MDVDDARLPDEAAWHRAVETGAQVVMDAIDTKMRRRIQRGDNPVNIVAMMLGGMAQLAQVIGDLTQDDKRDEAEEQLLAHVRGAFRGLDVPISEDGSRLL